MIVCFLSYTTYENDSKYFNQQKRDQKGKKHNQPTKQIGVMNNYQKNVWRCLSFQDVCISQTVHFVVGVFS